MECEIVTSSRHSTKLIPCSSSAHVEIDALDKNKALSPGIWEAGVLVRPRRIALHKE